MSEMIRGMNKWYDAVTDGARVSLFWAYPPPTDNFHVEGKIIAYSLVPQVLIETDTGERIWWREDMAQIQKDAPDGDDET